MKFASPIFDGGSLDEVSSWLEKAGLPKNGTTYLYDVGDRFHHALPLYGALHLLPRARAHG